MRTQEKLKFEKLAVSEMQGIVGGDPSIKFEHWHKVELPEGTPYTVEQRCTWWGTHETTETRRDL